MLSFFLFSVPTLTSMLCFRKFLFTPKYRFAETFFHNNDILMQSIHVFQRMGLIDIPSMVGPRFKRINMFYSSPDYYTEMKHQETLLGTADEGLESSNLFAEKPNQKLLHLNGNINWTTKTDDFFPYSDCPHCFWVGYFTSRAGFKRLERVSSAFLLAARQIESLPEHGNATERLFGDSKPLYDLEDASGIAQHHDGVSGKFRNLECVFSSFKIVTQVGYCKFPS